MFLGASFHFPFCSPYSLSIKTLIVVTLKTQNATVAFNEHAVFIASNVKLFTVLRLELKGDIIAGAVAAHIVGVMMMTYILTLGHNLRFNLKAWLGTIVLSISNHAVKDKAKHPKDEQGH